VQVTFKILCAHTMDGHVKMGGFNLVLEKFIVQSLHQYWVVIKNKTRWVWFNSSFVERTFGSNSNIKKVLDWFS
jgi:hypothetical protein